MTEVKCVKLYEKTFIYLNSIVNYAIWKMRNSIRYNNVTFDAQCLLKNILRSIGGRRNIDHLLTPSHRIPYIKNLYDVFIVVLHDFPFDNG